MTLWQYCKKRKSKAAAARDLGVSESRLSRWLAGKTHPYPREAAKIAKRLQELTGSKGITPLDVLYRKKAW